MGDTVYIYTVYDTEFDFEPKTERQKRNTNVKIIKKTTNPEIIQKLFHLSKT